MKYLGSKTIETNRLILKAQTMEEQYYLWSVLMNPDVNRYYLTVPKKFAEKLKDWDTQEKYYQEEMKSAKDEDVFKWSVFLKDTGKCIGRVDCHEAKKEGYDADNPSIRGVGWFLDPKYKGNGYGYEAAEAMMDYMFTECEIEEIKTGAAIPNPASWKIMEKFGFEKQNYTKMNEYTYLDEPVEAYQYCLTKDKYFEKKINELESLDFEDDYIIKKGNLPILFTAPHAMKQIKEDGTIKLNEPYTKAIALYLNKYFNVNSMIKIKDTGEDSNKDNRDKFKTELLRFIKENNIKLVIDLHGSDKSRDFDIEFGTLNNLSADFSTIKELEEAFTENGIKNVIHNDPFKGGAITKYVYGIKDVDVIQIEINGKYRDSNNIENLQKLIKSFEKFIIQYKKYINR